MVAARRGMEIRRVYYQTIDTNGAEPGGEVTLRIEEIEVIAPSPSDQVTIYQITGPGPDLDGTFSVQGVRAGIDPPTIQQLRSLLNDDDIVLVSAAGGVRSARDRVAEVGEVLLGRAIRDILPDPGGVYAGAFGPGTTELDSCANFVSATLRAAGIMRPGSDPLLWERITGVSNLRGALRAGPPFEVVYDNTGTPPPTTAAALASWLNFSGVQRGDVVIIQTLAFDAAGQPIDADDDGAPDLDPDGHAMFFWGFDDRGEPLFLGANGYPQQISILSWSQLEAWVGDDVLRLTGVYRLVG